MTAKVRAEEVVRKYYTWGIRKEGQSLSWAECKELATMEIVAIMLAIGWEEIAPANKDNYWPDVIIEIKNL